MTLAQARRIALALPEATESPHHEMTSFRVRGKIFATAPPDGKRLHVFVPDELREVVIAAKPGTCENLPWGGKIAGVRVLLPVATPALVTELLQAAWSAKAPASLRAEVRSPPKTKETAS
jgi:hypothetical protein